MFTYYKSNTVLFFFAFLKDSAGAGAAKKKRLRFWLRLTLKTCSSKQLWLRNTVEKLRIDFLSYILSAA